MVIVLLLRVERLQHKVNTSSVKAGNSSYINFPYVSNFDNLKSILPGSSSTWLSAVRCDAFKRVQKCGLPSQKVEEWKYSNLSKLLSKNYSVGQNDLSGSFRKEINRCHGKSTSGIQRLVFINGVLDQRLSNTRQEMEGIRLFSLSDSNVFNERLLEDNLLLKSSSNPCPFSDLNLAFMAGGCFLWVEQGCNIELELLFVAVPTSVSPSYHPRVCIVLNSHASASIYERHVAMQESEYWSNCATTVSLGNNSTLHHYKVQEESSNSIQTSNTFARLAENSNFESFVLATGASFSRNQIEVKLEGKGASATLSGNYIMGGKQHNDNHIRVHHCAPLCKSRQSYKGVLDDSAHGVFQGKTLVERDAQNTDGSQLSRTLMLSRAAVMDAKPELEIYADDVKCSHGAVVGELDAEQIFYLRSRGIEENIAKSMLVNAFLNDNLDNISNDDGRQYIIQCTSKSPSFPMLDGVGK